MQNQKSESYIKHCLKFKIKNIVYIIGDSHLRYAFFYLRYLFKQLKPPIDLFGNVLPPLLNHYYWKVTFILNKTSITGFRDYSGRHLQPTLLPVLKSCKAQNQPLPFDHSETGKFKQHTYTRVLVLQFCTWDIAFRNMKYFLRNALPAFDKFLSEVIADKTFS